jgi:hypothetical protein
MGLGNLIGRMENPSTPSPEPEPLACRARRSAEAR